MSFPSPPPHSFPSPLFLTLSLFYGTLLISRRLSLFFLSLFLLLFSPLLSSFLFPSNTLPFLSLSSLQLYSSPPRHRLSRSREQRLLRVKGVVVTSFASPVAHFGSILFCRASRGFANISILHGNGFIAGGKGSVVLQRCICLFLTRILLVGVK